ncbi:MAG: hypothetical protein KGL39_20750 [Patescibacteria group bacterium]|nr:hypothetical protein [Patescibacteria group bacterium]
MPHFTIEPRARMDLVRLDPSASPPAPLRVKLQLNTMPATLGFAYYYQSENGVSPAVYHHLTLEWSVPGAVDAQQLTADINAGELDDLLTRVLKGHTVKWDGNNHVGRLNADAADASEQVQEWLDRATSLPDEGGLWDAGDWLPHCPDGLTATTTDEELDDLASTLEKEALGDCVVLHGTVNRLRWFRTQLQDK